MLEKSLVSNKPESENTYPCAVSHGAESTFAICQDFWLGVLGVLGSDVKTC